MDEQPIGMELVEIPDLNICNDEMGCSKQASEGKKCPDHARMRKEMEYNEWRMKRERRSYGE